MRDSFEPGMHVSEAAEMVYNEAVLTGAPVVGKTFNGTPLEAVHALDTVHTILTRWQSDRERLQAVNARRKERAQSFRVYGVRAGEMTIDCPDCAEPIPWESEAAPTLSELVMLAEAHRCKSLRPSGEGRAGRFHNDNCQPAV